MKPINIKGQRFGKLTVFEPTNQRKSGSIVWKCQCDCGNIAYASVSQLHQGNAKSCGCLAETQYKKGLAKAQKYRDEEDRVEKTRKSVLQAQKSKANTSGYKGVSKRKNGKYEAYIYFQRKKIGLGLYDTLEEAKRARVEAEKEYHQPILDKYRHKK